MVDREYAIKSRSDVKLYFRVRRKIGRIVVERSCFPMKYYVEERINYPDSFVRAYANELVSREEKNDEEFRYLDTLE